MEYLQNENVKISTKGKNEASNLAHAGSRIFIVLNPVAGGCEVERVKQILKQHCDTLGIAYDIYETTGKEHLPAIVRQAREQDYKSVIAAGGDGTVSAVASELVHSQVFLGIIPVGTANLLARELNIPLELEAACRLAVKGGAIRTIDAMQAGDQILFSHISLGSYSRIAERTSTTAKRYFRQLAYVWSALAELIGTHRWRFNLVIDERKYRFKAAFIMIANVGAMGASYLRWGPDIKPDDGQVDICIVRARTLMHYLSFMWHILLGHRKQSPHTRYLHARKSIKAKTKRNLPVRGDGEIIGRSSIEIKIIPRALQVIVPEQIDSRINIDQPNKTL